MLHSRKGQWQWQSYSFTWCFGWLRVSVRAEGLESASLPGGDSDRPCCRESTRAWGCPPGGREGRRGSVLLGGCLGAEPGAGPLSLVTAAQGPQSSCRHPVPAPASLQPLPGVWISSTLWPQPFPSGLWSRTEISHLDCLWGKELFLVYFNCP